MPMLYTLFAVMVGQGICQGQVRSSEASPSHYYFHRQPEKALSLYLKKAAAGESAAAVEASIVLQELGRNREAVILLKKAVAKAPAGPAGETLALSLGWAYLYSGEAGKAEEIFSKAANKEEPRVLLGLALSRMWAEKYEAAAANFEELAGNRSLSALAYHSLATIAEEKGDADRAARLYEKSLAEDSHFVEGRPRLARIFESQGRIDDAWKQYSKTAMMDPSQKLAAQKAKSLLAMLTKRPEEILAVKRIKSFSGVQPVLEREASPEIRIGIGSTAGGAPRYKDKMVFRVSGPFLVSEAKTGKEVLSGKANEAWTVSVSTTSAGAKLAGPDGAAVHVAPGSLLIRPKDRGHATIILETVPYAPGMTWSGVADKELRGDLELVIAPAQKGMYAINRLPLEEYLYGVIPAEMPVHWPAEALKAQAVIARTYALHLKKNLRPHSSYGYDLCDEQHCQVYSGVSVENPKTRSSADLTRGKVLSYAGKAMHAVFSSNCGGHTQSGPGAGWADLPYWRMVHDGDAAAAVKSPSELASFLSSSPGKFCRTSKHTWAPEFRWTRLISAEDLHGRLSRKGTLGKLKKVLIARSESGRVASLRFVGTGGTVALTKEHEIRRLLGLAPLRSTLFGVDVFYEKDFIKGLLVYGAGWGHGVGLCQSGAAGRAEAGQTYDKILPAYYPGTILADLLTLK